MEKLPSISMNSGASVGQNVNVDGTFVGRDLSITNVYGFNKCLQAHQEAFTLWQKLLDNVYKRNTIGDVVLECQTWWNNNCLYLTADARSAFRKAYQNALHHSDYVEARADSKLIRENWLKIVGAEEKIIAGADLCIFEYNSQESSRNDEN